MADKLELISDLNCEIMEIAKLGQLARPDQKPDVDYHWCTVVTFEVIERLSRSISGLLSDIEFEQSFAGKG